MPSKAPTVIPSKVRAVMPSKGSAAAAVVLALAALATGCSPPGLASSASSSATPTLTSNEVPTPVPPQTASRGAAAPILAIEAFATGYINWKANTVSRTMRALESISIAQARSAAAVAASQTAQDYELRHGGVANSGTVEAVAPLLAHPGQYAVVTRERTSATNTAAYHGLPAAWHLTLATVARLSSGKWVVSGWQPES
jgi:ABC-type glycerol-3-phosphate transport system substrate-binding protein